MRHVPHFTRAHLAVAMLALAGCSKEARSLDPSQPQTAPTGNADPRVERYQDNAYQISQGGRYFTWYGCGACHGSGATGVFNLGDGRWAHGGGFADVYRSIAQGHPGRRYGELIPIETLWQITAYVRDLPKQPGEKRRRQDLDEAAEPQGRQWSGPRR